MTAPAEPTAPPVETKPLTQDQIDAITARTRSEGQRQGKKEQLDAIVAILGCTPEEARAALDKTREAEQGKLSEVERREQAAAQREQAVDARERQAQARERAALIRAELVTAGAGAGIDDATQRAEILADAAKLVDVADDADETAIREAVGKVKTRHAGMFGAAGSTMPSVPPGSGPIAPTNRPKSLTDLAREKFPENFATAS
jgi:hypothetical protein